MEGQKKNFFHAEEQNVLAGKAFVLKQAPTNG